MYKTLKVWNDGTFTNNNNPFSLITELESITMFGCTAVELWKRFSVSKYEMLVAWDFRDRENGVEVLKNVVNKIFRVNNYKYATLERTQTQRYNPIENYNMTENENTEQSNTDTVMQRGERGSSVNTSRQTNTTDSENNTTSSTTTGNQTDIESVTTFEANTVWNDKHRNTNNNGTTGNTSGTSSRTGTATSTDTTAETDTTKNDTVTEGEQDIKRTLTRSGNIGVTTTQQMLQQEREIAYFSLTEVFFDDVSEEILLSVY